MTKVYDRCPKCGSFKIRVHSFKKKSSEGLVESCETCGWDSTTMEKSLNDNPTRP
ncbi:MAG: zinc ribbon domain protein [Siphoviridae sp. ctCJE6]|nr:MAG: zinc ribbon domain protein [Siphoviridae sp. ctCJE6]